MLPLESNSDENGLCGNVNEDPDDDDDDDNNSDDERDEESVQFVDSIVVLLNYIYGVLERITFLIIAQAFI